MENNEKRDEEKNEVLREAFGFDSISIDDEDSLPDDFDGLESLNETVSSDSDELYEPPEENQDEKVANDDFGEVEILEGEKMFQDDSSEENPDEKSSGKSESCSPDFAVVNQKIQNLEGKTDNLLESVNELVQSNSQLLSDISTTIRSRMIAAAPEVISGIEDSVRSSSQNITAALKKSLETLPEIDEWAKKTSANFKSVSETLEINFKQVSESIENFRNVEKKESKIKNFKWLIFGVSMFLCLAAGAFCGWRATSSFISYESLITSHFDSRVEKRVNEEWSKVEKNAEAKAENIIKTANRQAKAILQKANEQAAEIQSSAIVSAEKSKRTGGAE